MSKESKFSVVSAESFLLKHKISVKNKVIDINNGAGLACLSAIDYLTNYAGYTVRFNNKG